MTLVEISSNRIMKPLLFLVLLVLSRIETNEATRTLDDTSCLLLPSLQTRPPVKTPSPNPGTDASVNMVTTFTERNFVGRKEATKTLDETSHLLLPSFQTRSPIKTPSPNPGTGVSVNTASRITERNFVGRKETARTLDESSHLLLPSLQTRPPIKTPSPNPKTGASVNMATRATERNFVGRKEATRTLDETSHLLLPSLQIRPPVKTPSPNPGTGASVNMAARVTERNFLGRKEATKTLDETSHLLLPSLQTHPPVKTPSPNPGTGASVNMAARITERNFVGRKKATKTLDETSHLLLPSLQTRPPVKTPSPNPGTGASVNMAVRVTERNFVGRKKVTKTLDETSHLLLPSLQTRPPVKTPSPNPGTGASVNMAARVTERNFVGRKEATRTLDETSHLLLSSLQTHPPVKTPSPNPGTGASVNTATRVAERNFVGRKEVAFVPPLPPPTNASPQNNVLCDVFAAKSQK